MKFTISSLPSLQRRQSLLYILIFTLVTITIWAGFSILRANQRVSNSTEVIPPELKRLARPLNPSIDTTVLTNLQAKKQFSSAELGDFPIYTIAINRETRNQELLTVEQAAAQEKQRLEERQAITRERAASPSATPNLTGVEILPNPVATSSAQ